MINKNWIVKILSLDFLIFLSSEFSSHSVIICSLVWQVQLSVTVIKGLHFFQTRTLLKNKRCRRCWWNYYIALQIFSWLLNWLFIWLYL